MATTPIISTIIYPVLLLSLFNIVICEQLMICWYSHGNHFAGTLDCENVDLINGDVRQAEAKCLYCNITAWYQEESPPACKGV